MATAIVLLNVEPREMKRTAEAIAAIDGVTEVYSVAGTFDLVAIVRVATEEKLADLVTEKIRAVPGIVNSQTLIAFRAFSRFDLDSMFEID